MRLKLRVGFGLGKLTLPALIILLGGPASFAQFRAHEGYTDSTGSPFYTGVKSCIDHVDPEVGCCATVAWVGIDNNKSGGTWMLAQGGWAKLGPQFPGGAKPARIYWEYVPETGLVDHARDYIGPPSGTEEYEVLCVGTNMVWKHSGMVYKTVPWACFDGRDLVKAEYSAEMLDWPDDHVPGFENQKNNWCSTKVRKGAGSYLAACLDNELNSAIPYGCVEKTEGAGGPSLGPGNFRTWDTRGP